MPEVESRKSFPRLGLAGRIALGVAGIFVLLSTGIATVAIRAMKSQLEASLAQQQRGLIKQIAGGMDAELARAREALVAVATELPARAIESPETARRSLERRRALQSIFDYQLTLLGPQGALIAAFGEEEPATADYAPLPHIRATLEDRAPHLSPPYLSAGRLRPVVTLTAPLLREGALVGILTGAFDLLGSNPLTRSARMRLGQGGYLAVITARGLVVTHTEAEDVFARFADPTAAALFRNPERSRLAIDPSGTEVWITGIRLTEADWVLAASLPTAELYAPVRSAERWAYGVIAIGTLLAILLSGGLTRWLTRDLRTLARSVAEISHETTKPLPTRGSGEVALLAGALNEMLARLLASHRRLRHLAHRLARTEERERSRIAADLHDSTIQHLAFAKLTLTPHAARVPEVESACREIQHAITDLRKQIFDIYPPVLHQVGLVAALDALAEQLLAERKLRCTLETRGSERPLEIGIRSLLYRAVRELLINVTKHARADHATVTLNYEDRAALEITVSDDGGGFTPSATGGGFGLYSIREQLLALGGLLAIDSSPTGSEVRLRLPLNEETLDGPHPAR